LKSPIILSESRQSFHAFIMQLYFTLHDALKQRYSVLDISVLLMHPDLETTVIMFALFLKLRAASVTEIAKYQLYITPVTRNYITN